MNAETSTGAVKSALRTLLILELFASEKTTLTLAEISRSLDMPKSSCLALLGTLTDRGYLYKATHDGRYYPTKRWLNNARLVAEHDPLAAEIHTALERLHRDSGETAIHAVLAGDRSVYVDVVESDETIRFSTRSADTKPLHVSASGRAQLGLLQTDQMMSIIERINLKSMRSNRPDFTRQSLVKLISDERARGWACNMGEHNPDVLSVAVGVDLNGSAHALVVAAPLTRAAPHVERIGKILMREAEQLVKNIR